MLQTHPPPPFLPPAAVADARPSQWRAALAPVEAVAVSSLQTWLPKLSHPIRVGGTPSQSSRTRTVRLLA